MPGILNTLGFRMSGFLIYQSPEYASGSEYVRALNKPEFWISQGSECIKVLIMPLVLNLAGFWICQSDWICLDLSEHAAISADMPKSAWMAEKIRPTEKILTHAENFDPSKKNWPRQR